MGGYGADYAENMHQKAIEEKAKLFEYLLKNMVITSERRLNGKKTLSFTTKGNGHCPEATKVLKYFDNLGDKRAREERLADYLRLKEEFEGETND